ncbi:MAG: hypothetical protein K1X81_04780 [Bacteroidia bacterium]|nr:hypothetical protein [Bacteroidia bacterium]
MRNIAPVPAPLKKVFLPLLITLLSGFIIWVDRSNLYNELLYAFFYTGLLSAVFFLLLSKQALSAKQQAVIGTVLFFSLLLRIYLFPFQSADYTKNFALWMDEIRLHGGLSALKNPFYDYAPPYMYLLVFITKLPVNELTGIKTVSLFFDYSAAFFVYGIVRQFRSLHISLIAAGVFLFLPTVVMNGALWGQCDIIYTCLLLAGFYFLLHRQKTLFAFFLSAAFAFKLQTVFITLLPLLLLSSGQLKIKHLLWFPAIYILAVIPTAMAGRPFTNLLTIYLGQASSTAHLLTANAPSVYALMPHANPDLFSKLGLGFTALFIAAFFLLYRYKKNKGKLNDLFLFTAALSLLLIPYFLPRMHERYFFAADVFLLVLAFRWPRLWFAPVVCGLASLLSYFPFLFDRLPVPFVYLSLPLLLLCGVLVYRYLRLFFFT